MENFTVLIFFAAIAFAFYFMIIRPTRQRQQAAQQVQSQLTPGVEVMTTAGIYGTVSEVHEDRVLLQVAPGVEITYARAAIAQVITESAPALTGEHDRLDDTSEAADDNISSSDSDDPRRN